MTFNKAFLSLPLLLLALTSCMGDDDDSKEFLDWKRENDAYITFLDSQIHAGKEDFTKVIPSWASLNSVYIKWHNDTSLTARNLKPLSNSTVDITYALEDIDGNDLGNSFSNTAAYGDSIYRSKPNQNIVGMWAAMLNMHEGDTVTLVIPYISGYGARTINSIRPYSNLIYHVKMKKVVSYEY